MTVKELNLPKNASLDDFVKRNEIRQKLFENVEVWTQQYCDAITQNYKEYHIRSLERNLSGDYPEYAQQQLDELANIADAEGMPIRLNVDFHGRQFTMGVKDFVYLKQLQN